MKLSLIVLAVLAVVVAVVNTEGIQFKSFDQLVDHFSRDTTTFSQRYFVDEDAFYPGGPIFIYVSGRLDYFELLHTSEVADFNKKLNGIIFGLEHRYFGASKPTPDTSTENLRFLTPQQATADVAAFIQYIKDNYKGVDQSKVILFGEEYGGAVAVWARQKLPHLIQGVWASSAYVNPVLNHYQLAENIGRAYRQIGGDRCYEVIENAFETLELLAFLDNRQYIKESLKLCTEIDTKDEYDVASLHGNLVQLIQNKLQAQSYQDIERSCDILTAETGTDYERFAQWLKESLYPNDFCFELGAYAMVEAFNQSEWETVGTAGGDRQQFYLRCAGFGQLASADSDSQPFGRRFSYEFFLKFCDQVFGAGFTKDIQFHNSKFRIGFGGTDLGVTNVYFTNGEFDPKISLGITRNLNRDAPADVIPLQTRGRDLRPSGEFPGLREVKERAKALILKWLNDLPDEQTARNLLQRFN